MRLQGRTVVFVNNYAGPGLGGGEMHLLAVVRAAVAAGMHAHVICAKDSELRAAAAEAGAIVAPYELERRNVVRTASRIRKYCRRYDAGILHTTGYFTNLLGRLAKRGGRPVLVNTVHVEPGARLAEGGGRAVQAVRHLADRLTCARADAFCPVSEAIAASLRRLGYPPEAITVIPNGIDTAELHRAAALDAELPAGFAGAPIVGTVARLVPVKAVSDFVRAAAIVARERADARFLVVGEGPERPGLEELAASLGVADRMAFTGHVAEPAAYIARFTVNVLSSVSEGAGIVLLEAMALGKPCVATDVGGIPEIVQDGRTGVLVPPRDPEALAGAVLAVLGDPAAATAMGEAGRHRVIDSFTARRLGRRYLELYRRLLAERGASGAVVRE